MPLPIPAAGICIHSLCNQLSSSSHHCPELLPPARRCWQYSHTTFVQNRAGEPQGQRVWPSTCALTSAKHTSTSLHFTSLHFTSLHFTSLYFTTSSVSSSCVSFQAGPKSHQILAWQVITQSLVVLLLQVRCRGGCEDEFCCQACEQSAWECHHCLLCPGPAQQQASGSSR